MSKELKAPDKVTQKMTRDGAVAENLTTGETSSISERPQEENYSAPAGVAAEKVVQHIGAEIERHAAKGAEKKALDATQPKTHSSRLQFSEAERATPELQKAIKKSDKAADCLDAARAAIPKQTKIKKERVFDEAKGKAKTRLSFEKTDKPPNGKLRHNPLSRPAMCLNTMKTRPPIMKYPPRCWVPMKSLRGSWRKQINTSVFPMCGAAAPRKPLLIAAAL